MRGRLVIAAAAALVGLLVGVTVNATLAQESDEGALRLENVLISSYFSGPYRGTVVTLKAGASEVLMETVMMQLDPSTSYLLVGSSKPCATAHGPLRSAVWRIAFATGPLEDDFYHRARIDRLGRYTDLASTRLYEDPEVGPSVQVACRPSVDYPG